MIDNRFTQLVETLDRKSLLRVEQLQLNPAEVLARIESLREEMPCQGDEARFVEAVIGLLAERNHALQEAQGRDIVKLPSHDNASPADQTTGVVGGGKYVTISRSELEDEHRSLIRRIQQVRKLLGFRPLLTSQQERRQNKSRS